ncbi:F-box protein CPR1-like [Silene latifolia]|uniref:F-box protein CPR1-like n=1 Tax=Silene latifolia TaxID=37657 RepID=UPI003D78A13D
MAYIPMEVVESCILARLPVKSLIRFKSVSKSWKTLISSSKFLRLHHRHANRLLLVSLEDYTLQVNNLDSPLKLPFVCPSPYPYNEQLPNFTDTMTVLASCEFFVLVSYWLSHISYSHLFLLNPSTLSCHRIPSQDEELLSLSSLNFKYKLYFDEDNDDCKVVRIKNFRLNDDEWVFEIEIYSCKTKMWRFIEHILIPGPFYAVLFNPVVCVNNLLYVIVDHPITERRIRCFDIQAERWTSDIVFPHKVRFSELRVFDGSLCLFGNDPSDNDNICAWVLKESWVKLMSNLGEMWYIPIAYRKGSRHEILCRRFCDSQLYWYNLKYKVATRAEFGGCAKDVRVSNNVDHICKESLINFHGRERVHTST